MYRLETRQVDILMVVQRYLRNNQSTIVRKFLNSLRLRSETFWDKKEKDYVSTNLLKYLVAFVALFVSSPVKTTRKQKFSRYRYRHEELLHS